MGPLLRVLVSGVVVLPATALVLQKCKSDQLKNDRHKRSWLQENGMNWFKKAMLLHADSNPKSLVQKKNLITRDTMLSRLKPISGGGDKEEMEFDLLIIGGGATGCGCALDAALRGLKVAMVERDDFSSGTSSKSTKLIHGGVRYLEKAFWNLDMSQYNLVKEALHERGAFFSIAPHLSYELPIMLPIYQWYLVPYYWAGSKMYDLLAGRQGLSTSYFLSPYEAMVKFPMLKKENLRGAMVYYDGAQNDSRMNMALAMTAAQEGAVVANHVEVIALKKDTDEKICGATLRDNLTGDTWKVKCKGIVNATGPFTDAIRKMDEPQTPAIVTPSSGVHLILPKYFCPPDMGLIDPKTSDGRVVFFLPWEGAVIAGTTDEPTVIDALPMPTQMEIDWILNELKLHLSSDIHVSKSDILAAWTGIRPLVKNPSASDTQNLVRSHMTDISNSGLLTIAGGKWTTYRAMAQDVIDTACLVFKLHPNGPCTTTKAKLTGAEKWHANYKINLIQKFKIDFDIADHLSKSYGTNANLLLSAYPDSPRLSRHYPYLQSEILYAIDHELACTIVDVIARRMRLAFLDVREAWNVTPLVADLMANKLNWSAERKQKEMEETKRFLTSMGMGML